MTSAPRWMHTGLVIVLVLAAAAAQARSTFNARFGSVGVAGQGIEQTLPLYIHFFPGDGEAVLRCEIEADTSLIDLSSATSNRGRVVTLTPSVLIDYDERPVAENLVDTLTVTISSEHLGQTEWTGRIHTSVQSEGPAAHTSRFGLAVAVPMDLTVAVEPNLLFPGQETEIALVVANVDAAGRGLSHIDWSWPESMVVEGEPRHVWSPQLAAGTTDTLHWKVQVGAGSGDLAIAGRGTSDQVAGSPVGPVAVELATLPTLDAHFDGDFVELGRYGEIEFVWSNDSGSAIEFDEVELQIPEAFTDVQITEGGVEAELASDDSGRSVLLRDVTLEPGDRVAVRLKGRPTLPGRFSWPAQVVPANHFWKVPVPNAAVVPVALSVGADLDNSKGDAGGGSRERGYATDLQVLGEALSASLDRQLASLSVPAGTAIHLQPDVEKEQNWIVEDALTNALMRRGYDISLVEREADTTAGGVLSYRLVDSRVVYSPQKRGFMRAASKKSREAFGDLFLSLELADEIVWANRVPAYARDEVPSSKVDVLGGSDIVERTVIQPDNKLVARTISASILGGLLYIFFVP